MNVSSNQTSKTGETAKEIITIIKSKNITYHEAMDTLRICKDILKFEDSLTEEPNKVLVTILILLVVIAISVLTSLFTHWLFGIIGYFFSNILTA